jgi:hypothetical protein
LPLVPPSRVPLRIEGKRVGLLVKGSLAVLLVVLQMAGCASIESLPQSAAAVDFSDPAGLWNSTKNYRIGYDFPATGIVDIELLMRAAQAGLHFTDTEIRRVDRSRGSVLGHKKAGWMSSEQVAGVYVRQKGPKFQVKVIVMRVSWDLDRGPASTANGILEGMRLFVAAEERQRQSATAPGGVRSDRPVPP